MSASLLRGETAPLSYPIMRTRMARAVIILALVAGAAAGLAIGAHGRGDTGELELTHLLRAMAAIEVIVRGRRRQRDPVAVASACGAVAIGGLCARCRCDGDGAWFDLVFSVYRAGFGAPARGRGGRRVTTLAR